MDLNRKYGIARKPGRIIGWPQLFDTREQAEEFLLGRIRAGFDWAEDMHVVETHGGVGPVYPKAEK